MHTFPSSQSGAAPPAQTVSAQISPVVHAFPSSQDSVLATLAHPVAGSQVSSVHTFPSSQSGVDVSLPAHNPPPQRSVVVQALPSSQTSALATKVHPVSSSQVSSVQGFESSHLGAGPPMQRVSAQVSSVVHTLPSSQTSALATKVHPASSSQVSSVQGFESSQLGAGPPMQRVSAQVSGVVHALPSSHSLKLAGFTHPVDGAQPSVVHTLSSSQSVSDVSVPMHAASAQKSLVVQVLSSSQGAMLFT